MTKVKSKIHETKRILSIQLSEEDVEDVTYTIEEENSRKSFKIDFYQQRWRSTEEWRLLLKEILKEIDALEELRLIK